MHKVPFAIRFNVPAMQSHLYLYQMSWTDDATKHGLQSKKASSGVEVQVESKVTDTPWIYILLRMSFQFSALYCDHTEQDDSKNSSVNSQ